MVLAILCKGIVMKVISFALKILMLTRNLVSKSFFNCMDIAALCLYVGQIITWIMIIKNGTF